MLLFHLEIDLLFLLIISLIFFLQKKKNQTFNIEKNKKKNEKNLL